MEIATVKLELVNEITFVPDTYKDEERSPYKSNYEATVSAKIGNVVKELTFAQNSKYRSSEGQYGTPEYKESWTEEWSGFKDSKGNPFQDLIDAGMSIDFDEVIQKYNVKVKKAKEHQIQLKKEAEEKLIAKRKEEYKTCWPLTLQDALETEKNKIIKAKKNEITIIPCSEESYIKGGASAEFVYKEHTVSVRVYDGKYEWNARELGNYKTRRYTWPMTALLKFIQVVDEHVATKEYETNKNNEPKLKRQARTKLLSEVCGQPVTVFSQEKYSSDRYNRVRGRRNWTEYTYMLVTKVAEKYGDPEGYEINTETDTDWKDGKHQEIPGTRTYSIRTLRKLSEEQFKSILDILLKDKKVIKLKKE